MIETREALVALDDILGVAGIDGVFVGPADLSIALSEGAKWEPRGPALLEAAGHVATRARAHGKFAGMYCYDGADARAMAELHHGQDAEAMRLLKMFKATVADKTLSVEFSAPVDEVWTTAEKAVQKAIEHHKSRGENKGSQQ